MDSAHKIIEKELRSLADDEIAAHSQRFFKTGPGQYGEGDRFLGIRVPVLRKISKKYRQVDLNSATRLLNSPYHEIRLTALLILVELYQRGDDEVQRDIYNLYLNNTSYINNWDLVDLSAPHIVGHYLEHRDRSVLTTLAGSDDLWERRISIMATFYFIRHDSFAETIRLADILLHDHHDLIHKAVGWMLREVGKRDLDLAVSFLDEHYSRMPRTMLRYAIERFPEPLRHAYLKGTREEGG